MNVPSIHGGKSFNEDELRLMIKQGNLQPTSVHKSRADAEAAAKARSSSMVPGPRNMYAGGQLVSPSVDGSRPGYKGKEILGKEKFIELITNNKDKTYNDFVEIINKNYTTQDGRAFTKNIVADRARAYDLSGTLQLEPAKGRSEESKEQRRKAEKKRYHEMRKTEEGRAIQKEWRVKSKAKEYKLKGMDPPATNVNESLWKDIVKTAKENTDGKGRFSIKGHKKSMKSKDFFSNKMTITDNVTEKTFTYNNMKNYINKNAKSFDIKGYDEALKSHKQKWFINNTPNLRNNINTALIPDWTPGKSQTAITVQHNVGRQSNPLKTSIAFWDANKKEHVVRTNFEKAWEKSKNSKTPLKDRKKAFNIFKTDIEKLNIKSQPNMVKRLRSFGTELDLEGAIRIAKEGGAKIPHGTFKKAKDLENLLKKLCPKGQASGGRIGFATGTPTVACGTKALEKGLKNGFKTKNQQVLAEGILKAGRGLRSMFTLSNLFGPAALAFTAAAEAGIVGYDMLSTGKSFREAIGDSIFNYALGDKTKIDSDEEFIKRLKNITVGPQGYQRMSDEQIGKMLNFKANLDDMHRGFDLFRQKEDLDGVIETIKPDELGADRFADIAPKKQIIKAGKILDNQTNQAIDSEFFPDESFQLDAQRDKLMADVQDYNRTNTPNRITDYMLSPEFQKGADATAYANLLVNEDQLKDAGTYGILPKVDQGIARDLKQTQYDINNLLNPTKINEFGQMFMDATPGEQSYFMGRTDFMEGGIASLNVKK
jgi:hypothetical protein